MLLSLTLPTDNGTTACKWDSVIPFDKMWERLNKLIKPNWAIVLFGSEPFSSALRMSNIKNYKYDWIWEKSHPTWFAIVKYQPMKYHEIISIFTNWKISYNPQMWNWKVNHWDNKYLKGGNKISDIWGNMKCVKAKKDWVKYPRSIQKFNSHNRADLSHQTQKPVPLMEYLIKTYSNEQETVLDFTAWSFSTGVWCVNTNREFIGIELDKWYYDIWVKRIKEANILINNK